ncbi:pimeloyl-ACP methyl ester carboxylesterase [Allocatelliglobosispora scoriae]|uniref:Pimeloyl-ACP methyl ester carboxylesterase n=1 Tax=Allocatelliglobosispora scoriae TaxID=643052 RepID=A0A841BEY8_9ACTN|nr:alpha/beta hydrolase [Allocatelliglobosispora scoriae]MBB5866864.1 pimeloyl-ACP methyl ester carboxylesterase [Allocatelliglobosispora scoriae]
MSSGDEASLALPDGRLIDYFDGGDPSGRPIFFQPGSPNTRIMGKLWHQTAQAAEVRIISVSRPGYGGSTAITDRPTLSAAGRDLADLADSLGLDQYAVVGSSGGGPFAVAAAAADPQRVRALGVVAGAGPWREIADPSAEPEERACLALLDEGDLAGARVGMRHLVENVWQADLRKLDDAARLDAWLGEDPLAGDEAYRAIMADAMRAILEGTEGAVFDALAIGAGWDLDLRAVQAPTLLWYGEADEVCTVEYGRWYAERIADAELIVLPGEDHLTVGDSHRPEVLAALLKAWQ